MWSRSNDDPWCVLVRRHCLKKTKIRQLGAEVNLTPEARVLQCISSADFHKDSVCEMLSSHAAGEKKRYTGQLNTLLNFTKWWAVSLGFQTPMRTGKMRESVSLGNNWDIECSICLAICQETAQYVRISSRGWKNPRSNPSWTTFLRWALDKLPISSKLQVLKHKVRMKNSCTSPNVLLWGVSEVTHLRSPLIQSPS